MTITAFITGYGFKAIVDTKIQALPGSKDENFSLGSLIKYFYPEPIKEAERYIRENKIAYIYDAMNKLREEGVKTRQILKAIKEYLQVKHMDPNGLGMTQEGNEMLELAGKTIFDKELTIFEKLHTFLNLFGRKDFEFILKKSGITKRITYWKNSSNPKFTEPETTRQV